MGEIIKNMDFMIFHDIYHMDFNLYMELEKLWEPVLEEHNQIEPLFIEMGK